MRAAQGKDKQFVREIKGFDLSLMRKRSMLKVNEIVCESDPHFAAETHGTRGQGLHRVDLAEALRIGADERSSRLGNNRMRPVRAPAGPLTSGLIHRV